MENPHPQTASPSCGPLQPGAWASATLPLRRLPLPQAGSARSDDAGPPLSRIATAPAAPAPRWQTPALSGRSIRSAARASPPPLRPAALWHGSAQRPPRAESGFATPAGVKAAVAAQPLAFARTAEGPPARLWRCAANQPTDCEQRQETMAEVPGVDQVRPRKSQAPPIQPWRSHFASAAPEQRPRPSTARTVQAQPLHFASAPPEQWALRSAAQTLVRGAPVEPAPDANLLRVAPAKPSPRELLSARRLRILSEWRPLPCPSEPGTASAAPVQDRAPVPLAPSHADS